MLDVGVKLKRNVLFNILEYLFVIINILQCYSVYFVSINRINNISIKISWCISLFILVVISLFYIHKRMSKYFINFLIYLSILTFLIVIISNIHFKIDIQLFLTYFLIPLCLSLLFYILGQNNYLNSIFNKFVNIMLILSVISLFFWILSIIKVPTNVQETVRWGSTSFSDGKALVTYVPGYFYIHFVSQGSIPFLGIRTVRNTGIFMEAPIYSGLLDMSLLVHLFLQGTNKIKVFDYKTIVLLITLFSTTSTNGLFVAIPAVLCAYCMNSTDTNIKLIIIPIIVIISLFILKSLLSTKANFGAVSSSSLRIDDFSTTIKDWMHHIIIGNGIGNDQSLRNNMAFWRFLGNGSNLNVSVGFTKALAYGGVLLGLYYIMPLIVSFLASYRLAAFSVFMFLLFVLEGIDQFPFFKVIVIYIWIKFIVNMECKHVLKVNSN